MCIRDSIKGLNSFAIKIASGFYENYKSGLPSGSGMMVVISIKTGFPEALLLDNGYLTDVRTGIAGAIAAKYLAKKKIETAGVIGAGVQARFQMIGLKLVRNFKKLFVYSIIPEEVDKYISEMEKILEVEIIKAKDVKTVVQNSDIVVTATPSRKPYLKSEWLHPGLHITAMGSDAEEKQELYPDIFKKADLLVCDKKSQCSRLGEIHHGLENGFITDNDEIIELGELISGKKQGRKNDTEITVCDLTGVGVQDTAIALLACKKAVEKESGIKIKV